MSDMSSKYGLSNLTLKKILNVFTHYPELKKVILYGSRAKGTYRKGSDIDITLKGKGINLSILTQISNEIDDLLLPYSFDISLFYQIENKDLIEHIERAGKEIYSI